MSIFDGVKLYLGGLIGKVLVFFGLIFLLILVSVLTGCGKQDNIDPELAPYVKAFLTAGNVKNQVPVTVQFGELSGDDVNGQCDAGLGKVTITISKDAWEGYNEAQKTVTMFHECGHCFLGREHDDTTTDGVAVSVMNSNALLSTLGYEQSPRQYVSELFN